MSGKSFSSCVVIASVPFVFCILLAFCLLTKSFPRHLPLLHYNVVISVAPTIHVGVHGDSISDVKGHNMLLFLDLSSMLLLFLHFDIVGVKHIIFKYFSLLWLKPYLNVEDVEVT